MAIKSVLAVVALCLCVQFSFAEYSVLLNDEDSAKYSVMCPQTKGHSSAPMPPDSCDVNKYLSCQNGKATDLIDCPEGKVVNRTKVWCVPDVNMTRPPGCPTTQQPKTYARTCEELNGKPGKVPMDNTCKMYINCDQTGEKEMFCQIPAFFDPEKNECEYIPPYSYALSEEFIAKCNRLDPY